MPRNQVPPKQQAGKIAKKNILELSLSDNQINDEDMDQEEDTQRENNMHKFLTAALLQIEEKATRSSNSQSNVFLAQRKALYTEARKNAKGVVQAGVSILENIRAQLEDLRSQELGFQKHHEDCSLPILAQKEALQGLDDLYTPVLKEIGAARSEKINEAFRMLKNNDPCRQEALQESSKRARYQLELTRQMEKDAIDARELIKHTKNLLHVKPARNVLDKRTS